MQLEFKKRSIDLNLYGEKVAIDFPTSKQLKDYLDELGKIIAKESDKTDFDITMDLLCKLGLNKEQCLDMEIGHLNELTEMLLDQKKS